MASTMGDDGHDGRARPGALRLAVAGAVGAASWQVGEYGLHRFAMHELKGRGLASREHLAHHADVTYFSPTSKKLLTAAGATAVALPTARALVGWRTALAYTAGMLGAYAAYEVLHRRAHTHAPATAYGRRMRKHHLHHHFGGPMTNHGVTSSVLDRAARTYAEPGVVTVPRRMAPVWLLDEDGRVRPEHAADYEVRGRAPRSAEQDRADHDAAFANEVPEPV